MADIIQVIKYEGDNKTFIWKHPSEDFNLGSQLIVHESQEAIFFMNGEALDLFGPGRYTLTTQNIPLVKNAIKTVTDGETPFHCEVYFINKVEQIGIKWGTDTYVNYLDPNFNNYPFPIGASGLMNLKVTDSRKLLVKIVGTERQLSQSQVAELLRGPMMAKIKSFLPNVLSEKKISIFDIDQHLEEFSLDIQNKLEDECDDYGLDLVKFWINAFVKPENDPIYAKLKNLRGRTMTDVQEAMLQQQIDVIHQQTKAQKLVIESQAKAQGRQAEGYTYQQERAYDVAERFANNEGVGNYSTLGVGMGMIGGIAGGIGGTMLKTTCDALKPIGNVTHNDSSVATDNSGVESSTQQAKVQKEDKIDEFKAKLEMLKLLKDELSEEEYKQSVQALKNQILGDE